MLLKSEKVMPGAPSEMQHSLGEDCQVSAMPSSDTRRYEESGKGAAESSLLHFTTEIVGHLVDDA